MTDRKLKVTYYAPRVQHAGQPGSVMLPSLPEDSLCWLWREEQKGRNAGQYWRKTGYCLSGVREEQFAVTLANLRECGFEEMKVVAQGNAGLWHVCFCDDRVHTPQSFRNVISALYDCAAFAGAELRLWDQPSETDVPSLDAFLMRARREFQFLVDDFGFAEPVSPGEEYNPFSLKYRSASVSVVVEGTTFGRDAGAMVYGLTPPRTKIGAGELEELRTVARIRRSHKGQLPMLRHSAQVLRAYAPDLLRGDVSIWQLRSEKPPSSWTMWVLIAIWVFPVAASILLGSWTAMPLGFWVFLALVSSGLLTATLHLVLQFTSRDRD